MYRTGNPKDYREYQRPRFLGVAFGHANSKSRTDLMEGATLPPNVFESFTDFSSSSTDESGHYLLA